MEEILASIRRIIADDDASKPSQQAPEAAKPIAPVVVAPVAPPPPPAPPVMAVAPSEPAPVPEMDPMPDEPALPAMIDDEADEEPVGEILELTESMTAPMPASPAPRPASVPRFRTIDSSSDVSFDEVEDKPAPQPIREPSPQLLSVETSAAIDSAFNSLAQTVLVQNARTLEDLVREMLRPMLKTWLDENLPGMVERLVRGEIERVSRGR
jgi:hypothetical protein